VGLLKAINSFWSTEIRKASFVERTVLVLVVRSKQKPSLQVFRTTAAAVALIEKGKLESI
jgi:hypothetical protein